MPEGILCQGIHRDLANMIPGPCRRIGTDLGIRAKGAFGKFCRPGALCKKMQPALRAGIRHEGGAVLCPFFLASGQFRAPVLPQGIVRRSACCADDLPPVPCQGRGRDGERPFTFPCQQVSEEEAPEEQGKGNQDPKLWLSRLVMKDQHAKKGARSTAKERRKDQDFLRDSPPAVHRPMLVDAVETEGGETDSRQVSRENGKDMLKYKYLI